MYRLVAIDSGCADDEDILYSSKIILIVMMSFKVIEYHTSLMVTNHLVDY